jgi:D-aminopeptidase
VTGSSLSNGSGDYVVAFSTVREGTKALVGNEGMSPLFQAVKEATEEAVYNSLVAGKTMRGHEGRVVEGLPVERVRGMFGKYGRAPQ